MRPIFSKGCPSRVAHRITHRVLLNCLALLYSQVDAYIDGPSAGGYVRQVLKGRIVVRRPSVQSFVAQETRDTVLAGSGRVEVEACFGELASKSMTKDAMLSTRFVPVEVSDFDVAISSLLAASFSWWTISVWQDDVLLRSLRGDRHMYSVLRPSFIARVSEVQCSNETPQTKAR